MRSNRLPLRAALGALMLLALRVSGCVDSFEIGRDAIGSGAIGAEAGSPASVGEGGSGGIAGIGMGSAGDDGEGGCVITTCEGKGQPYRCGDCEDNDADGQIDANDVECTGPCDDTEDSFYGAIPGQNNEQQCRKDCYFDNDNGAGNDQCYWTHECDVKSVPEAGYPPSGDPSCAYNANATVPGGATCAELATSQAPRCLELCRPLTPNGCDCFGCCELPPRSNQYVFIGSTADRRGTCNQSNLDDPEACRPCTPVLSCLNSCTACEQCIGGAPPDASCGAGTGGGSSMSERCDPGVTPCGQPGEAACRAGEYCITGCCVFLPL